MIQNDDSHHRTEIALVAGETSGDIHGALLCQSIQKSWDHHKWGPLRFFGIAGERMSCQGVEAVATTDDLSVMGLAGVLASYERIRKIYHRIYSAIKRRRPCLVILIDYPGFNLRLLQDIKQLQIPVVYHIPPKVWAHGFDRIVPLRENATLVNCVYPFERDFFHENGCHATFYGNPLVDNILKFETETSRHEETSLLIGLLPGSRKAEVTYVFPVMIAAFLELKKEYPEARALVPVASHLGSAFLYRVLQNTLHELGEDDEALHFSLFENQISETDDADRDKWKGYEQLRQCAYAWVCSGTASFEAAILNVPHSIVYKASIVNALFFKLILRSPFVGLPNLCLKKEVVPELLQFQCTPHHLLSHALNILKNKENAREMMKKNFQKLRLLFHGTSFLDFGKKVCHLIIGE